MHILIIKKKKNKRGNQNVKKKKKKKKQGLHLNARYKAVFGKGVLRDQN
jgi:hypothetical protein